ncbi:MAG: DUF1549 domain-containing protein [Planctomycetes bacterium]|nr:DUF1549 domain-containing protein [Planctomycetota bacterium]
MRTSATLAWQAMLIGVIAHATALAEGEPLHALIDERMAPVSGLGPAQCSDAEFLRRVSLDLVGMPPTSDEARQFISDPVPDKRQRLVDRLFASPHYARHLANTLDLMLMERRAGTHVSIDDWRAWLVKCVRENKPWNMLAREILQADGDDPAERPAARFALDRASDPNVLTRDVGRIFFGRDMQCAQCHDHPLVDDYLQSDYQGLLAFIAPSYALVRTVNGAQATVQAERPGTDVTFQSVFVGTPRRTGARAPDCVMIDEPFYLPGEDYTVAPADNVTPAPKFSRRAKLAEMATDGSNEAFNRNIANRLWAHMFGRGLVYPPDMQHPDNPASDPELLNILAERFAAMNFDIRAFLREIALSNTYQRSFDVPVGLVSLSTQATVEVAKFEAQHASLEQVQSATEEAYTKAAETWQETEAAMLPVAAEFDAARAKYTEAKTNHDAALKAAADATAAMQAKQALATPVQTAAGAAQEAAKTVPEDKALADAAPKISAKAEQLAAEITVLAKTVEEKTAATKPTADALAAAKPAVEAAHAKVAPLIAAVRQAEQPMLDARRKASADLEALAALDRRVETAKRIAKLPDVNNVVVVANQAATAKQAELTATEKQLAEFALVVAEHEQKVKTASDAMTAVTAARDTSRAEHEKRTQLADALTAAFTSIDAARQKLPDDPPIVEAALKLQASAELARTQIGESQKKFDEASAAYKAADETFIAAQEALAAALAERARREQAIELAKTNVSAAQAEAAAKQSDFEKLVGDLTDRWTADFTLASLKPLTPEQLCWTVFRVTGVYDRYWQAEVAELDKAKPMTDQQKKDPAQVAARDVELEQKTFDKLKENIPIFVTFYGAAAGQPQGDFFSTADQALFAVNGGAINSWVAPAAGNVTEKITKQEDPKAAAEELYLSVLTRLPSDAEAAEVVAHLANHKDNKPAAAQELVWALLNSAEFRFNH